MLVDQGKLDEAQKELNRALELQPAMAAARNTLGALRLKQGDAAAGEREIRAALEQKAESQARALQPGVGRPNSAATSTGAVAEYKKEIELLPEELHGAVQSGKGVRTAREQERTAVRVSRQLSNPTPTSPRAICSSRSCISISGNWTTRSGSRAAAPN